MSTRDQTIVDALQAAIPRAQLIVESAQRQHADAAAVLDALATAVTLLQRRPTPDGPRNRSLAAAVVRSGKSLPELAYLTAISEARLRHVLAGDPPTAEERTALARVLPDWRSDADGSTGGK
jgi:hypothetical protein